MLAVDSGLCGGVQARMLLMISLLPEVVLLGLTDVFLGTGMNLSLSLLKGGNEGCLFPSLVFFGAPPAKEESVPQPLP